MKLIFAFLLFTGFASSVLAQLDPSFGNGGIVITQIGIARSGGPNAIALQNDGKIVVGGSSVDSTNANMRFALSRFNSQGFPDSSFGVNGVVEIKFPYTISTYNTGIKALRIESDGKINAIGYIYDGSQFYLAIARLNSDGSHDASFGTGGEVVSPFDHDNSPFKIIIQPDAKILFITIAKSNGSAFNPWGFHRFNPDGSRDVSFGTNGSTLYPAALFTPACFALQADGKIAVGGQDSVTLGPNGSSGFAIMRFASNGTLDASFAQAGEARAQFNDPGQIEYIQQIAVQSDGKFVMIGNPQTHPQAPPVNIATNIVVRFNADGSKDNTFGLNGIFIISSDSASVPLHNINLLSIQPDDKITICGIYDPRSVGGQIKLIIARLTRDGLPDNTFKDGGIFYTGVGGSQSTLLFPTALVFKNDGSMFIAGGTGGGQKASFYGSGRFEIAHVTSSGSLDESFADRDLALNSVGASVCTINASLVQADGKLVVAGYIGSTTYDFALMRYNLDGSIDKSFGLNGIVTTDFVSGDDIINALLLNPDGSLIAIGRTYYADTVHFALAKYLPNGSLDKSFGTSGKVVTSLGTIIDVANGATLQTDSKIVLTGRTGYGAAADFATVRYNADGSLDNSFGTGGKVITDFGGADIANAITVQSDGKIIIGGSSQLTQSVSNLVMARYDKNGSVDPTFGTAGKVFNPTGSVVNLLMQSDGKILVNLGTGIFRYNSDGTLDQSYGDKGIAMDSSKPYEGISSFVHLADGRILTAGNTLDITKIGTSYASTYTLLRFTNDGKLDKTFGTGGRILTAADSSCTANTAVVDSTGRFLVSGYAVHNPVFFPPAANNNPVFKFLSIAYLKTLTINSVDFTPLNSKTLVYPDPIIGSTTLEYTIEREGAVSIDLLNMNGVCVQHFFSHEFQQSGKHIEHLTIDHNVAAGAYIIRVVTSQGIANVKVIVQ